MRIFMNVETPKDGPSPSFEFTFKIKEGSGLRTHTVTVSSSYSTPGSRRSSFESQSDYRFDQIKEVFRKIELERGKREESKFSKFEMSTSESSKVSSVEKVANRSLSTSPSRHSVRVRSSSDPTRMGDFSRAPMGQLRRANSLEEVTPAPFIRASAPSIDEGDE